MTAPPGAGGAVDTDRWPLFAGLFVAAACFHVLGNAPLARPSGIAMLAAAAAVVAWWPRSRWAWAALAVAAGVVAWQEAPVLGNHWLLFTFVAAGVVVAGPGGRAVPVVRACVLGFYVFAAFAKLNHGFFDTDVTCAGVYLGDVTDGIGLGGLELQRHAALRFAAAVATAAVELAVPVLLLRRRTRTAGVVLAVAFHLVVALPDDHQFYDFSSLLLAGWSTFLPVAFHLRLTSGFAARVEARAALLRMAAVAGVAVVGVLGAVTADRGPSARAGLIDVGWWVWQPLSVAALVAMVWWVRQAGLTGADVRLRPAIGPALVVPLLVVANGFLPYLEVKTSAGWNMYANLRTAGGESNHFLVRRTLPLTGSQDDLVEVVASSDAGLRSYGDLRFLLPVRTVRAYLQHHHGVRATLRVGGDVVEVHPGEPIPDRLGPPVSELVEKLFVLRAVDAGSPERCQPGFLPAR